MKRTDGGNVPALAEPPRTTGRAAGMMPSADGAQYCGNPPGPVPVYAGGAMEARVAEAER